MVTMETEIQTRMAKYIVILAEPKYSGNIGSVARCMKNFGLNKLILINPQCKLDSECYQRAMHAQDLLEDAIIVSTLQDAVRNISLLVGTTGIKNINERRHVRNPISVKELVRIRTRANIDGNIGLLFGREDFGLFNSELLKCDLLVKIPTDVRYPVMNVSHAACIIFYELYVHECTTVQHAQESLSTTHEPVTRAELDRFHDTFYKLLQAIDYPDHKVEGTKILFRRFVGRARLSKWEYHTLMGVLNRATQKCRTRVSNPS
jgi:TrmH family RNA methyltransferase